MTQTILKDSGITPENHMLKDHTGLAGSPQRDYTGFDPDNPFKITMPNLPREKYDENPIEPEAIKPEEVKHVE